MNENVMKFIELELEKDPGVSNATLFEGAKLVDRTIGDLNPRQFHAKYPLQVKRRLAGFPSGSKGRLSASAPARPKVARPPRAPKGGGGTDPVMAYVTRVLKRNPDVKNAELFAGACEIDASVADLSPRQFHAKYPLQVKRRVLIERASKAAAATPKPAPAAPTPAPAAPKPAPEAPKPAPEAPKPVAEAPAPKPAPEAPRAVAEPAPAAAPAMGSADTAAIRRLLLKLAGELAGAETQAETIAVVARLDGYVDDIVTAARS